MYAWYDNRLFSFFILELSLISFLLNSYRFHRKIKYVYSPLQANKLYAYVYVYTVFRDSDTGDIERTAGPCNRYVHRIFVRIIEITAVNAKTQQCKIGSDAIHHNPRNFDQNKLRINETIYVYIHINRNY